MKFIYLTLTFLIVLNIHAQKNYKKIITLAPNITEIIQFLNLEKNIIATDKFSPKIKNAVTIGDLFKINYEKLLKLKPDIILITENQKNISKNIKKIIKTKIHTVKIKNIRDINKEIRKISELLNSKYNEIPIAPLFSISSVLKNKQKVLVVLDRKNLSEIYVAGKNNFINDSMKLINLDNIIKLNGYPKINIEKIIKYNPDIIIDLSYSKNPKDWYHLKQLKAVKNKHIIKGNINLTVPSPKIFERLIILKKKIFKVFAN